MGRRPIGFQIRELFRSAVNFRSQSAKKHVVTHDFLSPGVACGIIPIQLYVGGGVQLVKKFRWLPFVRINVMSPTLVSTPYPGTVGHIHIKTPGRFALPRSPVRSWPVHLSHELVPVKTSQPHPIQRPCPF